MASSTPTEGLTLALENQTRALLAELDKRFLAMDTKWNCQAVYESCLQTPWASSGNHFRSGPGVYKHILATPIQVCWC
jgi:hypothetical protein